VQWFADGKSLLVTGNEPSRSSRLYRQSIDGGAPEPVTPEGVLGTLSPRGDRILALDSARTWQLYPLDGGPPTVAPGLGPDDKVPAWSPDGTAVYAHALGDVPLRFERVDLATGERAPSVVLGPDGEAGVVLVGISDPVLDPSRGIACSFARRLSTLYVVEEVLR